MKQLVRLSMLLLALTISISLIAGTYSGGTGVDTDNAYLIANKVDLLKLCTASGDWDAYFKQTADIVFLAADFESGGAFYNSGAGFSPIGNSTTSFEGSYDGDGHTIDGLYINRPSAFYSALFGYISGASIQNLGVTNVDISGEYKVGGLVGYISSNSTVSNCYSTGTVSCTYRYVGGLVGENSSNSTVSNCYSTGTASGTKYVGGLVGYNNSSTVSNSYSTGTASGTTNVGGLVGSNYGSTISNSYSTGTASGTSYVGGLAGYSCHSSPISNSYSRGNVTRLSGTYTNFGGFVGCNDVASIEHCYSTGSVFQSVGVVWADGTKGFVGENWNSSGIYTNNFFDKDASNQTTGTGATDKDTDDMKTESTFTDADWDFTYIWAIDGSTNDGYPYLRNNNIWDGSESSNWETPGNWDGNAVPSSTNNVVIASTVNNPIIGSDDTGDCNELIINSDAILTINSGGSLITNGAITNNGTISVERSISNDVWHLISSPITNATADMFDGNFLQYYDNGWVDITDPAATMTPANGYSLWSIAKSTSFTFSGDLNTGDQDLSTVLGWNLLGNPYPSSIDWSLLDDTYGAVYYWDPSSGTNKSWNADVGAGSQYVPAMQGFWIKTTVAGSFSLSNDKRTHSGSSAYYKAGAELANSIELQVNAENEYFDQLFIVMDDNATQDFDFHYDAWKLFTSSEEVPQLYSSTGTKNLSIDRRPFCDEIQLGFRCGESGAFTIKANKMTDFSELILEDVKQAVFHDLAQGDYTFDYESGEDDQRFKLHFDITAINDMEISDVQVYTSGNEIKIKSQNPVNSLTLRDITGRLLGEWENEQSVPAPETAGVYLLSVEMDNNQLTKKIIIE